MLNISPNLIEQFNQIQPRIWEVVTSTVTEISSKNIRFIDPLTVSRTTSEIAEELAGQKLVIQFSFDSLPNQPFLLVLSQEIFIGIANLFKSEPITAATENLVTDTKPILEAIVQGICTAGSEIQKETLTASNATFNLETFTLPEALQNEDELVRITIVINCDELNGSINWILTQQSAALLLGQSLESLDDDSFKSFQKQSSFSGEDSRSLDLLYDIPLEISVELGRVKMFIKDIIELSNGSIIEVDKVAGDPIDIMVNGKNVAKGEVIVVEDNFGVRITEILNPKERIQKI